MRIFLEADLLKWLLNLRVVPPEFESREFKMNSIGKYEIKEDNFIEDLEYGITFSKILALLIDLNIGIFNDVKDNLDLLKETRTQASKLYNWNIITGHLDNLIDLKVDKDARDLILAGDVQVVVDILMQVYRKCRLRGLKMRLFKQERDKKNSLPQIGKNNTSFGSQSLSRIQTAKSRMKSRIVSAKQKSIYNRSRASSNGFGLEKLPDVKNPRMDNTYARMRDRDRREELNLEEFDQFKEYDDTESCLEFIILALCRNISINGLQAAALLANSNKYLSQLIIRGKKHKYQPIINLMQEIYANCNILLRHMEAEESFGSVKFTLQALKPSLLSKELEVAKWGCRIYSKIVYDLANSEMLPDAWEWFTSLYGGFFALKSAFEKFGDDMLEGVSSVLMQIGRFSMNELFVIELRKIMPNPRDYVNFLSHIIHSLCKSKLVKEEIQNNDIFEFFIEISMKSDEIEHRADLDFKVNAMNFLVTLWINFPIKFEHDATLGNAILNFMKRSSRTAPKTTKISIFCLLFRLLDFLSENRNPYAPVVYKILIFSLIENFNEPILRELISNNIKKTVNSTSTIPVNVLVRPLTKQLHKFQEDVNIRMFDVELLRAISTHPRLDKSGALTYFDVISKLFLNSFSYSMAFAAILISLLRRNIDSLTFCDYTLKFFTVALSKLYESFKHGLALRFDHNNDIHQSVLYEYDSKKNDEIEKELRFKHKRAMIVNTLKDIIILRQENINEKLEDKLLFTNYEIAKIMPQQHNYKGTVMLLNLIIPGMGAENRISEYKAEMEAKEELQRSELVKGNFFGVQESPILGVEDGKIPIGKDLEKQLMNLDERVTIKSLNETENRTRPLSSRNTQSLFDDDLTDDDIRKFQEKHGDTTFGVKKRVLEREQNSKKLKKKPPLYKMKSKLNRKAMEDIERIKKEREDKLKKKKEVEKKKKLKDKKMRDKLNKQLEWRRKDRTIQRAGLEMYNANESFNLLRKNRNNAMEHFVLINPSEGKEENLEKEYINLLLVRFKKPLAFLFKKYSNSITQRARHTFEMIGQRAGSMSLAEVNKFLSDYNLNQFIDKTETAQLLRKINSQIFDKKKLKSLDSESFSKFMVNLAALIHSRPPINKPHYSYALMFNELLSMIDIARKKKGEDTPNFGPPKETVRYVQQKDLIDLMNQKIEENPNYKIPPNFKKVYQRQVDLNYNLPEGLKVNSGYKICYEILNDLVNDIFQVQLIEPSGHFYYKTKVKPREDKFWKDDTVFGDQSKSSNNLKMKANKMKEEMKKRKRQKMLKNHESFKIQEQGRKDFIKGFAKRKSLKDEKEITGNSKEPNSKKTLSLLSEEDSVVEEGEEEKLETGEEEEDDFSPENSVDESKKTPIKFKKSNISISRRVKGTNSNRNRSINSNMKSRKKNPSLFRNSKKTGSVINRAMKNKEKKEEEKRRMEFLKEKKRKERMRELEKKLSQMKKQKEDKEKQMKERQKKDEIGKLEMKRIKEEKRRLRNLSLKKKLKEYQERQKKEKEELEKKKKDYLTKIRDQKKKEAREFIKKQNEKLKKQFEAEVKKREDEEKQEKIKKQEEKEKELEKKKKLEELFADDREKRKRQQEFNDKISALLNSVPIQDVYTRYEMQLRYVFKHYIDLVSDPSVINSSLQDSDKILHYRNYFRFASQINIIPTLLSINEMKLVYRSTTRHKDLEQRLPIGLDYKGFQEILLRIAIKKKEIMNGIYEEKQNGKEQRGSSGKKKRKESEEEIDDDHLRDFSIEKHAEDKYTDIETVNHETLEGLMIFMDLPEKKRDLIDKLNSLRIENMKVVPRRRRREELEKKYGVLGQSRSKSRKKKPEKKKKKKRDNDGDDEGSEEKSDKKKKDKDDEEKSERKKEKKDKDDDDEEKSERKKEKKDKDSDDEEKSERKKKKKEKDNDDDEEKSDKKKKKKAKDEDSDGEEKSEKKKKKKDKKKKSDDEDDEDSDGEEKSEKKKKKKSKKKKKEKITGPNGENEDWEISDY